VGDHDTLQILTTKPTYRSLSAQQLSERTVHECRFILVQSCKDCKIERHVLDATVLGNYWPQYQIFTARRVHVSI